MSWSNLRQAWWRSFLAGNKWGTPGLDAYMDRFAAHKEQLIGILRAECDPKRLEIARQYIDSSRVHRGQAFFAMEEMQRCSTCGAGFGQDQRTVGKVERRKVVSAGQRGAR